LGPKESVGNRVGGDREERKVVISKSREKELESQGWVRRFVAEEPRLSEAVELYLSLGMEVHLEPLELDELQEEGQCTECLRGSRDRMRVIYTRCLSREGELKGRGIKRDDCPVPQGEIEDSRRECR